MIPRHGNIPWWDNISANFYGLVSFVPIWGAFRFKSPLGRTGNSRIDKSYDLWVWQHEAWTTWSMASRWWDRYPALITRGSRLNKSGCAKSRSHMWRLSCGSNNRREKNGVWRLFCKSAFKLWKCSWLYVWNVSEVQVMRSGMLDEWSIETSSFKLIILDSSARTFPSFHHLSVSKV